MRRLVAAVAGARVGLMTLDGIAEVLEAPSLVETEGIDMPGLGRDWKTRGVSKLSHSGRWVIGASVGEASR